jgi:hypothetical protein
MQRTRSSAHACITSATIDVEAGQTIGKRAAALSRTGSLE